MTDTALKRLDMLCKYEIDKKGNFKEREVEINGEQKVRLAKALGITSYK